MTCLRVLVYVYVPFLPIGQRLAMGINALRRDAVVTVIKMTLIVFDMGIMSKSRTKGHYGI